MIGASMADKDKALQEELAKLKAENEALRESLKAKVGKPVYDVGPGGTFTMQFGRGQPKWLYLSEAEALFADIENARKAFEEAKAAGKLRLGKDDLRFEASKAAAQAKRDLFKKQQEERKAALAAILANANKQE